MRVLIVEDEPQLAATVARGLRRKGLGVDVVGDGASALDRARFGDYDVVILDRDPPELHGDVVCQRLRETRSPARILMLTASGTTADLVEGLSLGADDYLGKPFAFDELVARVLALGRRAPAAPVLLGRGDISLDAGRREATRAGRRLNLTPKEVAVLEVLLQADGAVVSSEELLERVWDDRVDPFTNVVRVTVMTLRRKLGEEPVIDTVPNVGYRLR